MLGLLIGCLAVAQEPTPRKAYEYCVLNVDFTVQKLKASASAESGCEGFTAAGFDGDAIGAVNQLGGLGWRFLNHERGLLPQGVTGTRETYWFERER